MKNRLSYIETLKKFSENDFVKIITGVRRCGKSCLLQLYADYLQTEGVPASQIIWLNFEMSSLSELTDGQKLYEYLKSKMQDRSDRFYIFIDEVQEVENWAKIINSLRVENNCDIYVAGSNAHLFSGEHLTYLAGRYVEVKMLPLSFSEFLDFKDYPKTDAAKHFNEYLEIGSFPAIALTDDKMLQEAIVTGLFDSVFSRDIILRGKIKDKGSFFRIAQFVFENIGSPVSSNAIANTMKSNGYKITSETVDNYLSLMTSSYLLYRCQRYDLRGKERLKTNGKYYVVDTAIRNAFLGRQHGNMGHVVENIVFLELKRRGFELNIGKVGDKEIDFVAQKNGNLEYYQVALSVTDENTFDRELSSLRAVRDNFPKYLITLDTIDFSKEGIIHKNLVDFLLEE